MIEKTENGVRLLKTSENTLLLEIDASGAWWLAMALAKAEEDDDVSQEVMDFVCDNFGADITAGEMRRRLKEATGSEYRS